MTDPFDINRDGAVNAIDRAAIRANLSRTLTLVPAAPPTASARVEDPPPALAAAKAEQEEGVDPVGYVGGNAEHWR